jgi:hypothetical protein
MASRPNDSAERAVAADLAKSDSLSARAAFMSNLNDIAPMSAKRTQAKVVLPSDAPKVVGTVRAADSKSK